MLCVPSYYALQCGVRTRRWCLTGSAASEQQQRRRPITSQEACINSSSSSSSMQLSGMDWHSGWPAGAQIGSEIITGGLHPR
jgi:hypothetical protein